MNKTPIIIIITCMMLLMTAFSVYAENIVNVVVVGAINHGPMQPTVRAIKDVLIKYENQTNVTWYDMDTIEGQKYLSDHKLDAHLNILINGNYAYILNGKNVTFQWFEGQEWTKNDLDAVISSIINNSGTAIPSTNLKNSTPNFILPIIIIAVIILIAASVIIYFKTRKTHFKTKK